MEPTSLFRLWAAAAAAMSLTMVGRSADALAVLDGVAALADWTDWSADWFFARAFAQAHGGAPELAHETLLLDRRALRQRRRLADGEHGGRRLRRVGPLAR